MRALDHFAHQLGGKRVAALGPRQRHRRDASGKFAAKLSEHANPLLQWRNFFGRRRL
jgi:hypothetical protein